MKPSFKYVCLFVLALASSIYANAQKRDIIYEDKSIGLSVFPALQGRFLTIPDAPIGLADSLRKADKLKSTLNFGVQYRFKTGRDWFVTTGIYYNKMGFTRVIDKVNLLDVIHPDLPEEDRRVNNVVQGIPIEIQYHVNYHFIDIPVLFGKDITPRNLKRSDFKFSWFAGGSINTMILSEKVIELKGFTSGNDRNFFQINPSYYKPFPVNLSAIVGARLDIVVYPKTKLYIQPNIQKQLFYASYGTEKHHLYSLSAEIGLNYSLEDDKSEPKKSR